MGKSLNKGTSLKEYLADGLMRGVQLFSQQENSNSKYKEVQLHIHLNGHKYI